MPVPSGLTTLPIRLLLGGLLVVLVFGACSTSDFTVENATRYAPLTVQYTVRKQTSLFVFATYDTLASTLLYRGHPILPRNLCRPDTVEPTLTQFQAVPGYRGRWLLRVQCWLTGGAHQATYLLRYTASGFRIHHIGDDISGHTAAAFNLLGDNRAVWVPRTDTSGTLFDLDQLRGFAVEFPALPDSVRSSYDSSVEVYCLAPDHRTLARLFSPDTATQAVLRISASQPAKAPAPALYLDEYNTATRRLHRHRLPGRLLLADNPLQNTRWRQDSVARWHVQAAP
jgi:hypothetical protein